MANKTNDRGGADDSNTGRTSIDPGDADDEPSAKLVINDPAMFSLTDQFLVTDPAKLAAGVRLNDPATFSLTDQFLVTDPAKLSLTDQFLVTDPAKLSLTDQFLVTNDPAKFAAGVTLNDPAKFAAGVTLNDPATFSLTDQFLVTDPAKFAGGVRLNDPATFSLTDQFLVTDPAKLSLTDQFLVTNDPAKFAAGVTLNDPAKFSLTDQFLVTDPAKLAAGVALRDTLQFGILTGSAFPGPEEVNLGRQRIKADREIQELTESVQELRAQLAKSLHEQHEATQLAARLSEDVQLLDKLNTRQQILARVGPVARDRLVWDDELAAAFRTTDPVLAYVLSVDIRRSTELMLRATAEDFFNFISRLYVRLVTAIQAHHGVVDKFTGDGVLAFFPEFFSGADAGMRALLAARDSHAAFAEHFDDSQDVFDCVPTLAGLGIGIDYGRVRIMRSHSELTVVGKPVVYACRLSGVAADTTAVNRQAFSELSRAYAGVLTFTPSEFEVKNEGPIRVHLVEVGQDVPELKPPEWLKPKA